MKYTEKEILEKVGLKKTQKISDDKYKDKTLKIVSWVNDSVVSFKIKSHNDTGYSEFTLNDISELIENLIHRISRKPENTRSRIYKQATDLVHQAKRIADIAQRRFSRPKADSDPEP